MSSVTVAPSSPPTSVSAKWIQEQERVQLKWNVSAVTFIWVSTSLMIFMIVKAD